MGPEGQAEAGQAGQGSLLRHAHDAGAVGGEGRGDREEQGTGPGNRDAEALETGPLLQQGLGAPDTDDPGEGPPRERRNRSRAPVARTRWR